MATPPVNDTLLKIHKSQTRICIHLYIVPFINTICSLGRWWETDPDSSGAAPSARGRNRTERKKLMRNRRIFSISLARVWSILEGCRPRRRASYEYFRSILDTISFPVSEENGKQVHYYRISFVLPFFIHLFYWIFHFTVFNSLSLDISLPPFSK